MKKRGGLDEFMPLSRKRAVQVLVGVAFLYVILVGLEIPFVFRAGFGAVSHEGLNGLMGDAFPHTFQLASEEDMEERAAPIRPLHVPFRVSQGLAPDGARKLPEYSGVSGLKLGHLDVNVSGNDGFSELEKSAKAAWDMGKKVWADVLSGKIQTDIKKSRDNRKESCPHSIALSGKEFVNGGKIMVVPCGLTLGSHLTVVGKPKSAHAEQDPKISLLKDGDESVMVSQFMLELRGLKTVDGEDPPRILHLNPRLKGDWSGRPVIEQNTCYRMQWGTSLRCEGWKSNADEETSE